jgi:hypothetical protein
VLLNLPGFRHGGAYVLTYVEDASQRGLAHDDGCDDPDCTECSLYNFEPQTNLEGGRVNSLHKIDTLVAALRVFRQGLVDEFEPYDRRERELEASRE